MSRVPKGLLLPLVGALAAIVGYSVIWAAGSYHARATAAEEALRGYTDSTRRMNDAVSDLGGLSDGAVLERLRQRAGQ